MRVAVILPAYNAAGMLEETLRSVWAGRRVPDELWVVDDASSDATAAVARRMGAQVLVMAQNAGPAACRNQAALEVQSEVLVFLDADTCAHPDTLERMEAALEADATLDAVIGAYDEQPRHPGWISQYRNLAHCYVHRSAAREAHAFWSGCGAVRRQAFLQVEGFDERFRRPSVEDIELGYRMTDRGMRILLDPEVQVTHLKRWTLRSAVLTDVRDRGVPWMLLLLERGRIPNELNVRVSDRLATALSTAAAGCAVLSVWSWWWMLGVAGLLGATWALEAGVLRFVARRRGAGVLLTAMAMRVVMHLGNAVAVAAALAIRGWRRLRGVRRGEGRSSRIVAWTRDDGVRPRQEADLRAS